MSRACCSQPGTSRAPATRHNTQRQRVPGRLDSEGKCRKPVNRCRLSSKEPGRPAWPPPTNPYQLIILQGSGPPREESVLVHSFLGYKLPAHLTHDSQTWKVGREAKAQVEGAWCLRPPRCCLAPTMFCLVPAPEPQRQEAERKARTGARLGQLSSRPDGCLSALSRTSAHTAERGQVALGLPHLKFIPSRRHEEHCAP